MKSLVLLMHDNKIVKKKKTTRKGKQNKSTGLLNRSVQGEKQEGRKDKKELKKQFPDDWKSIILST
jgi:hypothetical protein